MDASCEIKKVVEKKIVLTMEMTVSEAIEMKEELYNCYSAYGYCRSYGMEEFYEDPVYLWPILKSLEKQINAIEYK